MADEIRQLSEQTKDASANITENIQKLNEDTKRANDSIMTAAESVEKQNQLIYDTRDKFNDVGNAVEKMSNCKKVLENIYLLAEDLKNSVENNENQ